MNQFLKSSKLLLKSPEQFVHVVLGNESCDLDSAVSALTYSYLLYNENLQQPNCEFSEIFLPVLNIPQSEFPLKTEVNYALRKMCITSSNLIFRDQINLMSLHSEGKLKLHLVDHHVLPVTDKHLLPAVIEIIDHRPKEPTALLENILTKIELVGSCCSLITKEFIERYPNGLTEDIGGLLHGTIVLDTANFSSSAKRATPLDFEMALQLEKSQVLQNRNEIFCELLSARTDITSLSSLQLLSKDLKILNNISLPGFPLLVKDFFKREDALSALNEFSNIKNSVVCVLLGMVVQNNTVTRDIAIFSKNTDLLGRVKQTLINHTNPNLELTEIQSGVVDVVLFTQGNITASRKQILPILKVIADTL